ncbi:MAG: NIPSNAP family protein [Alphaproteobacteria bacterium]|nr:NIPSNAP family protein [Alphaproteobacteria bacterium]
MIIEERIYTLKIGALKDYRDLYLAEGMDVQKSILGNLIGYYFTDIGTQNQVVHLWGYESFEDRETRRATLFSDPGWLSYISKVAPLIERQENRILKPLF